MSSTVESRKAYNARYYQKHQEKIRGQVSAYQRENRPKVNENKRKWNANMTPEYKETYRARKTAEAAQVRRDVMDIYGGECVCCAKSFLPHLTIDHVHGGGHQARMKTDGRTLYRRLRRLWREMELRDPDYQILCWCCNAAKHQQGRCSCQDDS